MTRRGGRLLAIANFAADNGTERMACSTLQGLSDSLEIHLLPARTEGRFFAELAQDVTVAGRLRGHVERGAFWINRLKILWHLLMLRPEVLLVFNYQWGLFAGAALHWLPRPLRPARSLLVHHLAVSGCTETEWRRIGRYMSCFSDHVVPSRALRDELLKAVPSLSPESVHTVHNGLDLKGVERLADQGIPSLPERPYRWLCVYVGGLRPGKRVDRLLRFFSDLPESEEVLLLLLGDGESRSELQQLSRELGLEQRCLFLGHEQNPYPYIRRADLLVQASDWETFGLTLLEAMSLKTPVLAMQGYSAGLTDVIQDGVNGRLVDRDDEAAFVEAWSALLQQPELRRRLADKAYASSEAFSLQAMVEGYREVLGLS